MRGRNKRRRDETGRNGGRLWRSCSRRLRSRAELETVSDTGTSSHQLGTHPTVSAVLVSSEKSVERTSRRSGDEALDRGPTPPCPQFSTGYCTRGVPMEYSVRRSTGRFEVLDGRTTPLVGIDRPDTPHCVRCSGWRFGENNGHGGVGGCAETALDRVCHGEASKWAVVGSNRREHVRTTHPPHYVRCSGETAHRRVVSRITSTTANRNKIPHGCFSELFFR